jgi:hypothetical protein
LSLAQITPSQLMGKATSFYFLIANLLGLPIGPTVVALVSASLFTDPLAIIHSMMLCYPLLTFCNVLFLGIFAVQLRRSQRSSSATAPT